MRFLLTPVGSSGDVHPYVGIGRELRERGHDVSVLTAEPHRSVVESAGLEFVSVFSAAEYEAAIRHREIWHPTRSFRTVLEFIVKGLEPTWRELEARYEPGRTFVVGHPLGFAARAFEDKTGVAAATLQLAPSSLRTVHRTTVLPPATDISGWPLFAKRAVWWLIDRLQIDPLIAPPLNRWRAEHGLPPVRRIFRTWMNSPRRVLALFPEWFGPRQPDWPPQLEYVSFPLWDAAKTDTLDPELERFLQSGSAPVVATPGSANTQAAPFFAALAAALTQSGRRGLFLTGFPEQLPRELPGTIVTRRYAPLARVLPHAAVLVHHGGVGTMAQAFAAGTPQLVMPMAFDQPDNAMRAQRLGAARFLTPKRFTPRNVAAVLGELGGAPAAAAAARVRAELRGVDGIALACDVLERDAAAASVR